MMHNWLIRVTHEPTGETITLGHNGKSIRTQHQAKQMGLKIIKARLFAQGYFNEV
jgi:protein subunit release factor A